MQDQSSYVPWDMQSCDERIAELEAQVSRLSGLVLSLSEKLYTVAQHLARLAERKEVRG